jgi:hypothetical protein
MRTHQLTTVPMLLVAAGGLVVGLAAPAAGREASHLINGNTIQKHSIAGDRLKNNTVTGKQIKESTLGIVPEAETLPPLKWHKITGFTNGWENDNAEGELTASWAIDAQGTVHLRGVISGGDVGQPAFTLPPAASPPASLFESGIVASGAPGDLDIAASGVVTPYQGIDATGSEVQDFSGLDGLTFTAA